MPELRLHVRAALDAVAAQGSESWRIAGAAARRLGLDRLYPFDDHSDGGSLADIADADHGELMVSPALAVVGHAHKGPLESALRTGQGDLDLADVAELDAVL